MKRIDVLEYPRLMFGKQHRVGEEHAEDEWCLQMGCRPRRRVGIESKIVAGPHRGLHDEGTGGWCAFYGCEPFKEGYLASR